MYIQFFATDSPKNILFTEKSSVNPAFKSMFARAVSFFETTV